MRFQLAICTLVALGTAVAGPPWKGKNPDPTKWSHADLEQILSNSPWSQTANAEFPDTRDEEAVNVYSLPGAQQAGLPGGSKAGATDGRWDGGVGRDTGHGRVPNLPVLVRWDSAAPVREALSLSHEAAPPESGK